MAWFLEDCYNYRRHDLSAVLEKLLRIGQLVFDDKEILLLALADFTHGRADFSDYVIGRLARKHG